MTQEESVPFAPSEEHWKLAGAEMPEWVCEVLDAREAAALPAPAPEPEPVAPPARAKPGAKRWCRNDAKES